eukprot:6179206-Pleurochrysis_carterae.AAC.1
MNLTLIRLLTDLTPIPRLTDFIPLRLHAPTSLLKTDEFAAQAETHDILREWLRAASATHSTGSLVCARTCLRRR